MFAMILKYLLATVVPAVVTAIAGKHLGPEAGVAIGGAVATVGARVLHKTEPPAPKQQ